MCAIRLRLRLKTEFLVHQIDVTDVYTLHCFLVLESTCFRFLRAQELRLEQIATYILDSDYIT